MTPTATASTPSVSAPGSATTPTRSKRRRRRGGIIGFVTNHAIPLLIAVLGLATALATTWGALVKAGANELEDSNASLEGDKTDLEAEVRRLEDEVAGLTQERDQLQDEVERAESSGSESSADDESPSVPPVTTSASPQEATVRRQTGTAPLTFSSGYSVDLDSDAPDWEVDDDSGGDLYFYISSGDPRLYTDEISAVDHVPTRPECENATVLQPSLPRGETRQGLQICTRTNEDRLAYVHIVQIDLDAATITLDLVVWD